ncbi:MAG: UDP-N-acetylmuramoyl-tripeptide--D-alanyl-D-alanine ligase [Thermoanaerobaculia bacterium]|nr:UDP-N-acetylmuramoyl-tripeptide--D-alanyl-D-alanine ligase [Thermoanaerobaculia bacterium]
MPALTFARLAAMTGGVAVSGGEIVCNSIVIDNREARPGSVFFAIRGDKHDGHSFLAQALEVASGAVVSTVPEALPAGRGIVQVDDTTAALQRLAAAVRREFSFTLVGVTGSAGKTTTKEMIATLAESEKRAWKSWGNFNNHIGFPLCLANTPEGTDVVVSEMGMSAKGEIEFLAKLAHPNVGVYTTIRPVHLEFFESIDGIAAAKRELLENLAPGGTVVLNADDPKVMEIGRDFSGPRATYALAAPADYRATDIRERGLLGTAFRVEAEGSAHELELSMPGLHNLENLMAAIATARVLGVSWSGVARAVADVKPAYHRGIVIAWHGATIYDDTYNSNPWALARTFDLLATADCEGRRIAVVGDMLELGPDEKTFHFEAGRTMPKGIDIVVGVGRRSKFILDGARTAGFAPGSLFHFDDALAAARWLRKTIRPGDLVMLKASRGIGLDRAVAALEEA